MINPYSLRTRNLYSQEHELSIIQHIPNRTKTRIKYPLSLRDFCSHENTKYLGAVLQRAHSRATNKHPRNHRFLVFPKEKTRHHPVVIRGTQEAREPIRGSRIFRYSVRPAAPRPRRMRQGGISYARGSCINKYRDSRMFPPCSALLYGPNESHDAW